MFASLVTYLLFVWFFDNLVEKKGLEMVGFGIYMGEFVEKIAYLVFVVVVYNALLWKWNGGFDKSVDVVYEDEIAWVWVFFLEKSCCFEHFLLFFYFMK